MSTQPPSVRREVIDRAAVDRFLASDPIAVVGVHRDRSAFANGVYRRLRAAGHHLVPVHPSATEIEGDPAVSNVTELGPEVGALLVMLRPEDAAGVVAEAIGHGIERVWLHRGAGTGAVSDAAVESCRAAGVEVVAGACPLMFVEPVRGLHRLHRFVTRRRIRPSGSPARAAP